MDWNRLFLKWQNTKGPFYVITKGRKQGIYKTWKTAKKYVEGCDSTFETFEKLDDRARNFIEAMNGESDETIKTFDDETIKTFHDETIKTFHDETIKTQENRNTYDSTSTIQNANSKQNTNDSTSDKPKDKRSKAKKSKTASKSLENLEDQINNAIVCFTDGSSLGNGTRSARGGFATVFPKYPQYSKGYPLFTATNNQAELSAVLKAFKVADVIDPARCLPLFIYTDSKLIVQSMNQWIVNWKKNNWMKSDKTPVMNSDLLRQIEDMRQARISYFIHVYAHTKKQDLHSLLNDCADKLAVQASTFQKECAQSAEQ